VEDFCQQKITKGEVVGAYGGWKPETGSNMLKTRVGSFPTWNTGAIVRGL
jgi:hypothetical protein